jgi:hypothetical protein
MLCCVGGGLFGHLEFVEKAQQCPRFVLRWFLTKKLCSIGNVPMRARRTIRVCRVGPMKHGCLICRARQRVYLEAPSVSYLNRFFSKSCAHADSLGLSLDARKRSREIVACGMRRSHKSSGKFGSTEHRTAIKWFTHVQMARSLAVLRQCRCGGTN